MDGLAATLAVVACATFAVDAIAQEPESLAAVLALSLGFACAAFLPFNLRPGRRAVVFMGDSGSQVIGFGLASLALASSWTTAGSDARDRPPAAARARDPDPRHDAGDRAARARAAADRAGRQGSLVAPARLLRPQRAAGGRRAGAPRDAARSDGARVQRPRRRPGDRVRRARLVRRARPVRELPRPTSRSARAATTRGPGRRSSVPSSPSRAGSSRCSSTS